MTNNTLSTRTLGKSGLQVSSMGFGTWGIGGPYAGTTCYGPTDDAVSLRALEVALEHGVNLYDTAPTYGGGHSETLLGQAFRHKRDQVIFATKAGYERFDQPPNLSVTDMVRVFQDSLNRLGTDYIDLLQLYNPPVEVMMQTSDAILSWVDSLRRQGAIRAFGVSVKSPEEGQLAIEKLNPDAIQVNFNMIDQRIIDNNLLMQAEKANVALIARTPLCFGFLAGTIEENIQFDSRDHRSLWPRTRISQWIKGGNIMAKLAKTHHLEAVEAALRYPLSFRSVACVIPGMMQESEVRENCRLTQAGPLDKQMVTEIRDLYESNNQFRPE